MLHIHLNTLLAHAPLLSQAKVQVTRAWVHEAVVTSLLERHDIDIEYFVNYYASGVFDYFLNVVAGTVKLGHCPVMAEFLHYLKKRNITADELFILCSHFKKAMIDVTYFYNINSQAMFAAISYLFDANFSGVLRLYTDTIYQKELVITQSLSLLNEYKNAIDTAAIVSKTDTQGTITYVNANFCAISGYTQEELLGANHNVLRHSDTTDDFYQTLWNAIQNNRLFKGTIKNQHKNGHAYYIDMTIVPLLDPMQGVLEYISIGYDVTTLVRAKEQAYEASQAKEAFLSAVSHEIRTPLHAILGFVSVLESDTTSPLHAHYLEIISHSGAQLLHIINDILDFSKIQNQNITLHYEVFNLQKTLHALMELFAQNAHKKGVTFDYEFSSALPLAIRGDSVRIQQVLSNLLSNAIKFTPTAGRIHVKVLVQKSGVLSLSVKDTGKGMSPAFQEEIFKPFVQEKGTKEGTGLGLSITKELVDAMQGTITLQSTPHKGTLFTVTLPFEEVASPNLNPQPAQKSLRTYQGNVLIAEDNDENCELLTIILHKAGFKVTATHCGTQALEAFKKSPFDLVILDDEMPHLAGYEAAARMREIDAFGTPIIMLSANATPQMHERALKAGCDAYLTKPLDIQALDTVCAQFLNRPLQESLAQKLELSPQEVAHLLALFKKNLQGYLGRIQSAIAIRDYKTMAQGSHKLKGSATNFHFHRLVHAAQTLEDAARLEEHVDYEILFKHLLDAVEALRLDEIPLSGAVVDNGRGEFTS